MVEGYNSLLLNDLWEIVPRPNLKSMVDSKWLYRLKHVADGSIEKQKARFVAQGFSQKEEVDYDEISAPIARYNSIGGIMSLTAYFGWSLHQLDVQTAFLNSNMEEQMYTNQSRGFKVHR